MVINTKQIKRIILRFTVAYWALAVLFYVAGSDGFRYSHITEDGLSPGAIMGEMWDAVELRQQFSSNVDYLQSIELMAATYERKNTGILQFRIEDLDGNVITQSTVDVANIQDGSYFSIGLKEQVAVSRGQDLVLVVTTQGCEPGNAVTFYCGNSISTGRYDIVQNVEDSYILRVNGEKSVGTLCMKTKGVTTLSFYKTYWVAVFLLFAIVAAYVLYAYNEMKRNESNMLASFMTLFTRYGFLIRQLVSRDFKVKYKRSALGVLWSFLNPLLTMLVQYIIFSTLFKSSIPNFPVYLLTGTVFFSFFSEATSLGIFSITGNASLIKKVYLPKYIYPLSRVLSSLVNFAMAFAPLLLVMVITRTQFTPAMVLLIYDVIFFLIFIFGAVLLLSTSMVFFQDTQFLWNVVSMLWMYMTPIFYPESIISSQFIGIYRMNPLYQYITFARVCILEGTVPKPELFLGTILCAAVSLGLGAFAFKKQQDKFIMYL